MSAERNNAPSNSPVPLGQINSGRIVQVTFKSAAISFSSKSISGG